LFRFDGKFARLLQGQLAGDHLIVLCRLGNYRIYGHGRYYNLLLLSLSQVRVHRVGDHHVRQLKGAALGRLLLARFPIVYLRRSVVHLETAA